MTEDTKRHALDIIAQLSVQRVEIEKLASEAMQDYSDAVEVDDMDARKKAFREAECYVAASMAIGRAITELEKVKEGKYD